MSRWMKALIHRLEICDRYSRINLRGFTRGMTQHSLQMPDRCPSAQHVRLTEYICGFVPTWPTPPSSASPDCTLTMLTRVFGPDRQSTVTHAPGSTGVSFDASPDARTDPVPVSDTGRRRPLDRNSLRNPHARRSDNFRLRVVGFGPGILGSAALKSSGCCIAADLWR